VSTATDTAPLLQLQQCRAAWRRWRLVALGLDMESQVVAQLTQLTALRWEYSAGLTDMVLEMLTSLTNLYSLHLEGCEGLSDSRTLVGHVC
jgi:hypothetical protein